MSIESTLQQRIAQECLARQAVSSRELLVWIEGGQGQAALEKVIFFTPAAEMADQLKLILEAASNRFDNVNSIVRLHYLRFLSDLYISLRSSLPRWNLQYGSPDLKRAADQVEKIIQVVDKSAPHESQQLLGQWRKESTARLRAEAAKDPQAEADTLVGRSIGEYLENITAAIERSNVQRISAMRFAGQNAGEFSNDFAAFLPYAMLLGASFVTCNPVLVDGAWAADPEKWEPVVDRLIAENDQADDDQLAQRVTGQVVLSNMLLLRPIFLLTGGRMGCVCLQVNPNKHGDAAAMLAEALGHYEKLTAELSGGVPNVVFKLPGTKAGLEAGRALTERGIGVTITVNFGMFQHIPFAQAIQQGHAQFSCLVEMNGRLAFPVRDELLAHLSEFQLTEKQARNAAAWSGVAVAKRAYRFLKESGCDPARIKLLIASLRVYEGDAFAGLPSSFPDITETLGTGILSIFPDIRRVFDAQPSLQLDPRRIESPVPGEIMAVLAHSELFKQAYYVPGDDLCFRPACVLRLEDEDQTAAWIPMHNTLTQFGKSYDSLRQRVHERRSSSEP